MKTSFDKRLLFGVAALLPLLTACNPALQWRDPPQQARTKAVCSVRALSRDCVQLTEAEFRDFTRRVQPEV